MIDHGVLDGVSAIIGCHLESKGKCGDVYVLPGPMLASTATFEIEILGKGGHAASPHQTIDPILVGAQVVTALQGIISRRRDPLHRLVLSVTQFHAGSKDNIIPQSAKLAGTVRVLDSGHSPGYNVLMKEWMEQAIKGVTSAFDAEYCFKFEEGYGALYNDADIAAIVRAAAEQTVGEKSVHVGEPNMAGDDMGYYLQKVPGCYYVVGCGQVSEDGMIYPNHHPKFQIHPDALPKGTEVAINALCALLEE